VVAVDGNSNSPKVPARIEPGSSVVHAGDRNRRRMPSAAARGRATTAPSSIAAGVAFSALWKLTSITNSSCLRGRDGMRGDAPVLITAGAHAWLRPTAALGRNRARL